MDSLMYGSPSYVAELHGPVSKQPKPAGTSASGPFASCTTSTPSPSSHPATASNKHKARGRAGWAVRMVRSGDYTYRPRQRDSDHGSMFSVRWPVPNVVVASAAMLFVGCGGPSPRRTAPTAHPAQQPAHAAPDPELDRALGILERNAALTPHPRVLAVLAIAYERAGRRDEADRLAGRLRDEP